MPSIMPLWMNKIDKICGLKGDLKMLVMLLMLFVPMLMLAVVLFYLFRWLFGVANNQK